MGATWAAATTAWPWQTAYGPAADSEGALSAFFWRVFLGFRVLGFRGFCVQGFRGLGFRV